MDAGTESGLIFCFTIEKRPLVGKNPLKPRFSFCSRNLGVGERLYVPMVYLYIYIFVFFIQKHFPHEVNTPVRNYICISFLYNCYYIVYPYIYIYICIKEALQVHT